MKNLGACGLNQNTIDMFIQVFKKHQNIEQAILYGSRAKGNFKKHSDIDLTLKGNELDTSDLFKIENELDDLMLPYTIDSSLLHQIDNTELVEHINRVGVSFYLK